MKLKLMLFQAPPPAQESGEGVLIEIEGSATRHEGKQQGNETTMGGVARGT